MNGAATLCTAFAPNLIGPPAINPARPPTAPAYLPNGSWKSKNFSSSTNLPATPNVALSIALHNPTPTAFKALPTAKEGGSSTGSGSSHGYKD